MATSRTGGRPHGAAGRAPRTGRGGASRKRRSRAALPARTPQAPLLRLPRATLTARAAILAVALASVALAVALPFKVWVAQRSHINALQAQTRAQEQRVAALRRQQQLWKDPTYVEQQARLRLHYALPGETTYVVLGKPHAHHKRIADVTAGPQLTGPWYSRLWQTVEVAGKGTHPTS
ncbi:MAG: septum formation initiator family protein [Frankiales bacterium]|nr:septum formation initiator family protein [Frankiales bacterium]